MTPSAIGSSTVATTVSTRLPPAGTPRPLQVTTPAACAPPLLAETKLVFASSASVTPTFVASVPPEFASVIVQVSCSPGSAWPVRVPLSADSALVIVTAASVGTTTHCGPFGGHAGGVVPVS